MNETRICFIDDPIIQIYNQISKNIQTSKGGKYFAISTQLIYLKKSVPI